MRNADGVCFDKRIGVVLAIFFFQQIVYIIAAKLCFRHRTNVDCENENGYRHEVH